MHTLLSLTRRSLVSGILLLLTLGLPVTTLVGTSYADDVCTPPASDGVGVHQPTGSSASTFIYQCSGQYAGQWTNAYYVYNPTTQLTTALYAPDYRYNCAASQWTMVRYEYSPASGTYYSNRVPADTTPNQATNCPVVAPTTQTTSTQTATPTSLATDPTIASSGNGSTNNTDNSQAITIDTTNNANLGMNNTLTSQAASGNAIIVGNTTAGGATTGDAESIATIANLLQSATNAFGPGTATFTADINGDVNGDFMFDPSAILASGVSSTNTSSQLGAIAVNQANDTDAAINNNVNVGASSGDATVTDNTIAGDATTGNAKAIVNLMNLINSTVASGKSFVGTININGNLNGDILLPSGLLDQLLATGPDSTNTATNALNVTATATNNTNTAITNDIDATAATGNATVLDNTAAGSATTGTAGTNVTLLNLTGSQVVGADDILVFINVLGHWVGMIMNAPAGTTTASLGGGISSSGPNSLNSLSNTTDVTSSATTSNNLGIHNTVNANAQTGNATVSDNTRAGNAKTGDAQTAVNVLNIANTNLALSNWFGVLFINVFGAWNGSFGVNTSAGDPISNPTYNPVQAASQEAVASSVKQFASFTPKVSTGGTASTNASSQDTDTSVLGSTTTVAKKITQGISKAAPATAQHTSYLLPFIGLTLATLILITSERGRIFGDKR